MASRSSLERELIQQWLNKMVVLVKGGRSEADLADIVAVYLDLLVDEPLPMAVFCKASLRAVALGACGRVPAYAELADQLGAWLTASQAKPAAVAPPGFGHLSVDDAATALTWQRRLNEGGSDIGIQLSIMRDCGQEAVAKALIANDSRYAEANRGNRYFDTEKRR